MENPYIAIAIMSFLGRILGRESWIDGYECVGIDRERYFEEKEKIKHLLNDPTGTYSFKYPRIGQSQVCWHDGRLVIKAGTTLLMETSAALQRCIQDAERAPDWIRQCIATANRRNAPVLRSYERALALGQEIHPQDI